MDLSYGEEYEIFRKEVQAFLSENWPPQGDDATGSKEEQRDRFRGRAIEVGYLARSVPKKYGGSEQPAAPVEEERKNAMAEELAGATQLDGAAPPAVRARDAGFTLSVVQGLRGTPGDLMREVHTQPDRFVM